LNHFFTLEGVPVHCNRLWGTREEALKAPLGDIELVFCQTCGHVFNRVFQPDLVEYDPDYGNPLHHSTRFRNYARVLARELVDGYALQGKDILEIGSGDGYFLALLCSLGENRGVGFDPGYSPSLEQSWRERDSIPSEVDLRFVAEEFSGDYAHTPADFVVCRHVLEHLPAPRRLLETVRRLDAPVFFEVPNMLYTLRELGIWDIIYEHVSYFSPRSLAAVFRNCGFEVEAVEQRYGGQFLSSEARPAEPQAADVVQPGGASDNLAALVSAFGEQYHRKREHWKRQLAQIAGPSQGIVLWGAGSKGVMFLNVIAAIDKIEYAVDSNPDKQGQFIPGSGQEIVSPAFLQRYKPDGVILMNPLYESEIRAVLAEMGLSPEIYKV